jgi:hypothetical protein
MQILSPAVSICLGEHRYLDTNDVLQFCMRNTYPSVKGVSDFDRKESEGLPIRCASKFHANIISRVLENFAIMGVAISGVV